MKPSACEHWENSFQGRGSRVRNVLLVGSLVLCPRLKITVGNMLPKMVPKDFWGLPLSLPDFWMNIQKKDPWTFPNDMNPICGGGHGGGAWWHAFLYLPQTVDGSQLQWATKMLNKNQTTNKHSTHRQQPSSRAEFYSRWKLFSKKNYCWILLLNLPSYLLTTEILDPGERWSKAWEPRLCLASHLCILDRLGQSFPQISTKGIVSIETVFHVTEKRNNKLIGT